MRVSLSLLAVLLLLATVAAASSFYHNPNVHLNAQQHSEEGPRVLKSRRTHSSLPPNWSVKGVAKDTHPLTFDIALRYRNTDLLNKIFIDVSNPDSPNYGDYLSKEEVAALIGPSEQSFVAVEKWLLSHGIATAERRMESIRVRTSVARAASLFPHASFHHMHNEVSDITVVRHLGELSIPAHLEEHVELVLGLSELVSGSRYRGGVHKVQATDLVITPPLLKSYYNVPTSLMAQGLNNTQSIAAFSDYFSAGALAEFQAKYHLAPHNITKIGPDCLPNCDQGESDLDIQYVSAMGTNITTIFHNQPDGYWILQWNTELINMDSPPRVNSVSYGWSEFQQCEIATTNCQQFGYDSAHYVARTDQNFQILGARGVTVLVSDGDDGAPSLGGADGNCPVAGNSPYYCPMGGCDHTSTKCGQITISSPSVDMPCYFPMGQGSNACQTILNDQSLNDALNAFANANPSCNFNFESDKRQGQHVYSECSCSKLKSATSGSLTVSGYKYTATGGRALNPDYPTSSPYVLSVGATQFLSQDGVNVSDEVGASILTGAIITTGGGFSGLTSQLAHQSAAISSYLNSGVSLPPSSTFDGSKRGYPDVSFNGHHYDIFIAKNGGDAPPFDDIVVDGTSCSSPALAGLLALINDQLIAANKPVLGYINPLLYKMASERPDAFHDIVSGNNKCNRQWCCEYGFEAAQGWDPVGGLGSPNFGIWLDYILNSVHKAGRKF